MNYFKPRAPSGNRDYHGFSIPFVLKYYLDLQMIQHFQNKCKCSFKTT